ncbi:hypothetical protein ABT124_49040 [Streptomyces sp. NPDC001982]|uniref:hypothetical protein n=1 Tax=Streptomyces sp. NPDC001982 TaxID=3154405 RepID=UPI0033265D50
MIDDKMTPAGHFTTAETLLRRASLPGTSVDEQRVCTERAAAHLEAARFLPEMAKLEHGETGALLAVTGLGDLVRQRTARA